MYSMVCFYRIWTSGHNFFRKCALMLLTVYSELKTSHCRLIKSHS